MALAGFCIWGLKVYAHRMVIMLRSMGAKPEGAKMPRLLRIPWKKAAREMNARKGNMNLVRKTVSLKSSMPNKRITRGQKITPAITVRVTKKVRKVRMHERNSLISDDDTSPFSGEFLFLKRYSLKIGMNATEIDPSAKRRRKRFGIMKATEKASERALVPSKAAFVISLMRPRILETMVSNDNVEP